MRPRSSVRVAVLEGLAVGLVGVLTLGACSSSNSADPADPAASAAGAADASAGAVATWNPCSGLDPAPVGRVLGQQLKVDTGTEAAPLCELRAAKAGGVDVNVNYQPYQNGLGEAFDSADFGKSQLSTPTIPGADTARLVVRKQADGLAVSGFLQNDDLIQVINVVQPSPYDRADVVAATTVVMTQLSEHAVDSPYVNAP